MGHPSAESDTLEELGGAACRRRGRPPCDPQRHHHVLECAELAQEMVELEHEADLLVAEPREIFVAQAGEVHPADGDAAAGGSIERAKDVQQRALPGAARADDRHHLTLLHGDGDAIEHRQQTSISADELLREIDSLQHGHSCRIASTGYSRAACRAGYSVARAAIARLASTIIATSSTRVSTGR